jgi:hypothetical protein
MNERVLRANAEGRNQAVDRLANSMSVTAKRPIVKRRLTGQISTAPFEHLKLEQLTLHGLRRTVVPNALEHLTEDQIGETETLSVQLGVHPLGLWIRDAAKVIDPDGGVDDHHDATL